ncbi:ABC transporter permease [Desulfuribacillus alkaliarsenatis]|uniref:ABC transporter permease n=1 Tax=Desulfuribacillus alkaliarsenatis TaxID=766136 RepID=A0A1E5G2H1_9FIRM|nr:ABC transporter permease [Desulfuribacillus alkaliarsenatis]OEF97087.1 ABC transporter permease [Desulfuribacillus alkaliarsenatis]
MNIFRLIVSNLLAKKARFIFTLMGITLGITSLVILITLGSGLRDQIHQQASDFGANLIITPKGWCAFEQSKVLSGTQLPDAILPDDVEKIDGIEGIRVMPYLTVGSAINNEPVSVTGVRIDEIVKSKGWTVKEGRTEAEGNEVIAGAAIAESFELSIGQTFRFRGVEFTLIGILEATGTSDDGVLFVPLEAAQEAYATEGRVSYIAVQVEDINKVDHYAQEIAKRANVAVITDRQLLNSVLNVINTVNATLQVVAAVAVLTAAFGIINTMLTATYERKKEIGILKATGASNINIFRIFLGESAFYGLLGGAIGLIVGSLAAMFITPYIAQNEFAAFIGNANIQSFLAITDMVKILVGSIVLAIVAGLYPAWRAARLTPVEAINHE